MRTLKKLFDNNARWAEAVEAENPGFFDRLSKLQSPRYLWIGCADSRVPANEITGLLPGEMFVHRNVANVVVPTDLNCLSVMQFAVDVLRIEHIIVCGHYGCGGVHAALENHRHGLVDNWLRHIQDVRDQHAPLIARQSTAEDRCNRLCELNALEQALNVCQTTVVQDAWERRQRLHVHAWVYALSDGRLRDLGFTVGMADEVEATHKAAVAALGRG